MSKKLVSPFVTTGLSLLSPSFALHSYTETLLISEVLFARVLWENANPGALVSFQLPHFRYKLHTGHRSFSFC